ncbi:MAG: 3-dehydroquinate synthase [Thermoanaerobacterales bacterium]|nr:3-dehydroquinate synthase [Bacillota bacterium]MDI6906737.1 3-dehydroquinate synthase [Thermoanaerobacterales bacterium]
MKTRELIVPLGRRSYPVIIGAGILDLAGLQSAAAAQGEKVMVITNSTVGGLYGRPVRESLERAGRTVVWAEMPDGEEYKTLETVAALYDQAFSAGLDRGGLVVALGGGVVGDVAGFAAATYMRGVAFAQVPTTLLAQVDSSVGGKVGVNHPKGKNIIGAFYQPRFVLADVRTLCTLPAREIRAGLAEVIKYGVIRDAAFFAWLEENLDRLLGLREDALAEAVYHSCRIKAEVVAADETEQGLREVLNFGHTVGHALESLTSYRAYRHGEAVAAGMVAEARLAMAEGMLSEADYRRLCALVARAGLPVELPDRWGPEEWLEHFTRDKKTRDGRVAFVLPTAIGRVVVRQDLPSYAVVSGLFGTAKGG